MVSYLVLFGCGNMVITNVCCFHPCLYLKYKERLLIVLFVWAN
jgi:hypothetical protein